MLKIVLLVGVCMVNISVLEVDKPQPTFQNNYQDEGVCIYTTMCKANKDN